MKDVIEIHEQRCPNFQKNVQLSQDGVSESKSTTNSIDVFTTRFQGCQTIYAIQLVKPLNKFKVNNEDFLDQFLTDICINDCTIDAFIGDNKVRSNARNSKGHAAYFPCEYCECKGHLLNECDATLKSKRADLFNQKKILENHIERETDPEKRPALKLILKSIIDAIKSNSSKNNNIVWPSSTYNGKKRTIEGVLSITAAIEEENILSIDESKGITGRSLFLEIPYFNYILHIPAEYLHSTCLGVTKRLICLTFCLAF